MSNFRWQACYPAKLNQSFSMEVIEEESENEDQEVKQVLLDMFLYKTQSFLSKFVG